MPFVSLAGESDLQLPVQPPYSTLIALGGCDIGVAHYEISQPETAAVPPLPAQPYTAAAGSSDGYQAVRKCRRVAMFAQKEHARRVRHAEAHTLG